MTGDRGPGFDHESEIHHDYALVEIWIGCTAVNVGSLTSTGFYTAFVAGFNFECKANAVNWRSYNGGNYKMPTNYVKDIKSGATGSSQPPSFQPP
jgi:hypothetical protein